MLKLIFKLYFVLSDPLFFLKDLVALDCSVGISIDTFLKNLINLDCLNFNFILSKTEL